MEEDKKEEVTNEKLEKQENPNEELNMNSKNDDETVNVEEQPKEETIEENPQSSSAIIEVKKEKKKKKPTKKRYLTGTIGAILGGIIFVLPWIFRYIYARKDFVITLLSFIGAALIPLGAYLGYKLFRGKVGKPFPVIITIFSMLIIIIATAVICPLYLMQESLIRIDWANYINLFSDLHAEVRDAIIEDTIAGLVFTITGLVIVIKAFVNKQLRNLVSEEERALTVENARKQLQEKTETVKQVCEKLNCMSRENAVTKKIILKELKSTYNLKTRKRKQYFLICRLAKLLKRQKGKYYYDENNEEIKLENPIKINKQLKRRNFAKVLRIIIITILLATAILVSAYYIWLKVGNFQYINNTDVVISIDDSQRLYGTPEQIAERFGEGATAYYDFILEGKEENAYDIYGQIIKKTDLPDYNSTDRLMQDDRDYYALYYTEETTSEVVTKKLANKVLKTYNYKYGVSDEEIYPAIAYLYETKENYVFLNVFDVPIEVKIEDIDVLIEELFK